MLLTALAGMFATSFPVTLLTVSLGEIAADFDTSETTIAWVVSLPLLVSALALPVLGKLGDLRGHRKVFLVGFALATVAAVLTPRRGGRVAGAVPAPGGTVAADAPLLPLELLGRRNFSAPIVASAFTGAAYMGGFVLAPLTLRSVFGYTLSATALLLVIRPVVDSASAPVGGRVAVRLGERVTAVGGSVSLAVSLAMFAVRSSPRSAEDDADVPREALVGT